MLSQGVKPQGGGRYGETTSCSGTGVVTIAGWSPILFGVQICSTFMEKKLSRKKKSESATPDHSKKIFFCNLPADANQESKGKINLVLTFRKSAHIAKTGKFRSR